MLVSARLKSVRSMVTVGRSRGNRVSIVIRPASPSLYGATTSSIASARRVGSGRGLARPRLEPLRALEVGALALEIVGHAIEILDQAPQLVGRCGGDARVEVASRDAPRRAAQTVDRIAIRSAIQ